MRRMKFPDLQMTDYGAILVSIELLMLGGGAGIKM
jgi:hypothetical protein